MDRALWISWYDLPEAGRDGYLSWLRELYVPRILQQPGVLWAAHYASEENVVPLGGGKGRVSHTRSDAVPSGDRFILIFGAEEAHAFTDPAPRQLHARLPEHDRKLLAMRTGERMNLMVEEARAHGPEAGRPEYQVSLAPCIQLGSFNAASPEDEDELATWYTQWRLPSMKNVPGCVRVRKLVSVAGWAKHACLYEFTSVATRNEHFVHYETPYPEMEAWSKRVAKNLVHAPGSANLARCISLALKRNEA
jgi:hypothetical protein